MPQRVTLQEIQRIGQSNPQEADRILSSMSFEELNALKQEAQAPAPAAEPQAPAPQDIDSKLSQMSVAELEELKTLSPAEQQRRLGVAQPKEGFDFWGAAKGLGKAAARIAVDPGSLLFDENARAETLGGFLGGMQGVESVTAAPTREMVRAAQEGEDPFKAFGAQFGAKPETAATGKDIAALAGLSREENIGISPADVIGSAAGAVFPGSQNIASDAAKSLGVSDEKALGVSPAGIAGFFFDMALDPTGILTAGAGKGMKMAGKGLTKAFPLKQNADDVLRAAASRGVKATPGQLYDSQLVGKLEGSLLQSHGKIGGSTLRKTVKRNIDTLKTEADNVIGQVSAKDLADIAADGRDKVQKTVMQHIDSASKLYDDFTEKFADELADTTAIRDALDGLADDFAGTPALSEIKKWRASVSNKGDPIKTIGNLKRFRTAVGKLVKSPDPEKREIARRLYDAATEARSESLMRVVGDDGIDLIEAADEQYKKAAELVEQVTKKKTTGGVQNALDTWLEKNTDTGIVERLLRTSDPEKLSRLRASFPEAFETFRQGKIANLARKIKAPDGSLSPKKFAKAIDEMPAQTANLLLGPDAKAKAKDIEILLQEMPELFNPSKSGEILEFFKMFNVASQGASIGRSGILKLITSGEGMQRAGQAIQGFALPAQATQQAGRTFGAPDEQGRFGLPAQP